MYANGRGAQKDDREAFGWFQKAAEQGYAAAQANLGWMYANGQGVQKDDIESYVWYDLAARQGNEQAMNDRENLAKKMTPDQIAEAQRRASAWKE